MALRPTPHFPFGSLVRLRGLFTDNEDPPEAADPTSVSIKTKDPNGEVTTYTSGTSPAVEHPEVGEFYVDVPFEIAGTWHYRVEGSGQNRAAREGSFIIDPSAFVEET